MTDPLRGRFIVQGTLPGLNELFGASNHNRFSGAAMKKKETKRCELAILAGKVPTFTVPVRVLFVWVEKDLRRDPDNVCVGAKFVLDALVQLKRIPNDSRRWIKGIVHEFPEPDKGNPRVEIVVQEA